MELSDLEPILSRSGVEPPTGTIHPRESRGTANRKQESAKRFISGERLSDFGIAGRHLAGVDRSGRGFPPDRQRPTQNSRFKVRPPTQNRLRISPHHRALGDEQLHKRAPQQRTQLTRAEKTGYYSAVASDYPRFSVIITKFYNIEKNSYNNAFLWHNHNIHASRILFFRGAKKKDM